VNGSGRVQRRRFLLWLTPVVLASIAIPAGRSDAAEQTVSQNTVTEGLKTIERAASEIAEFAGEDQEKAQAELTAIQPVWSLIEHTLRANDSDAYAAIEKAIEGLEAATNADDANQADSALKALGEASKSYAAKPASGASTPAPAPGGRSAAAAPAPAAAEAGDAALARTGSASDALAALAGLALALGGLSIIGGARRRPSPIA
jgi:LPXTG-motif cell wall-anchored protein